MLTCFSNDFGYEEWVKKSIDFYADKGDSIILISAGGNSQNMVNAANFVKDKKIGKIITFTGNDKNNNLSKLEMEIFNNIKAYNHIENVHQILLLSLVDLVIGKSEYSPN